MLLLKRNFMVLENVNEVSALTLKQVGLKKLLLNKLKNRFEKTCYQGMYIKTVLDIVKFSPLECMKSNNNAIFSTSIDVQVEGYIPDTYDVIHNCNVIRKQSNYFIVLKNDHVVVNITEEAIKMQKSNLLLLLSKINIGWNIPVILLEKHFLLNEDAITGIVVPYYPRIAETVYFRINKGLSENDKVQLQTFLDDIDKELLLHKDVNPIHYKGFVDLMYPYKKEQNVEGKEFQLKMENFDDLGIVYLPSSANKIKRSFYKLDKIPDNSIEQNISALAVYANFLTEIHKYLITLRGFLTHYPTKDSYVIMEGYWKEYYKLKAD